MNELCDKCSDEMSTIKTTDHGQVCDGCFIKTCRELKDAKRLE